MGVDANGRDVFARVIWGGRNSMAIGVFSIVMGFIVGGILGLLAGYAGLVGWLFYNRREFESPPSGPLVLPLVLVSGFFAGSLNGRSSKSSQIAL